MDGLLLFGFPREVFEAFRRAGHRPKVWVRTGRKPGETVEDGTVIYDHTPLKLSQVDYELDMTLDRELAARVRRESYPYYLRAINRSERCRRHAGASWADKVNRLELMINWYHAMLVRHDIRTLVFSNIPHGGSTIALFFMARAMGMRTLICYQAHFDGLFFMMEDFREMGFFPATSHNLRQESMKIEDRPASPFYMVIDTAWDNWRLIFRHALKLGRNLVSRHFGREDRTVHRRREICALFDRLAMLRLQKSLTADYDPSVRYVYFPLHYQPEMSPDVIGGVYADQLLALEELRRELPDDVIIYVKENPKQSIYAREPSFFKRLGAMPGTVYLPGSLNTFGLTENALAVATIAGTAGWEALQMGKPVICFGAVWYRSLPGVLNWPDDYDFEKLENFRFDRDRLQSALQEISRHFHVGLTVVKGYSEQIADFDPVANAGNVVRGVLSFLEEHQMNGKPS